jgi:uncharacterized membrane protein
MMELILILSWWLIGIISSIIFWWCAASKDEPFTTATFYRCLLFGLAGWVVTYVLAVFVVVYIFAKIYVGYDKIMNDRGWNVWFRR